MMEGRRDSLFALERILQEKQPDEHQWKRDKHQHD